MKKIILAFTLLLGASAISIASHGISATSVTNSVSSLPREATHRATCVTNPDNLRAGQQEVFFFAYDSDGVIWVYGTPSETFSSPIRTVPSGRSDFNFKFMRAGVLWFLPA